ncbi:hypothetical protein HPB50_003902 [Hyalomma asiaticum]|uniref:Uncharacterized protein n=1 Tax=Hyalomma asiaticum TaxID=266040 RepID=A0ACB7T554_HYAAI|nr:hypothetical protein HPB50_003902 [Hyalomma asiaticum]
MNSTAVARVSAAAGPERHPGEVYPCKDFDARRIAKLSRGSLAIYDHRRTEGRVSNGFNGHMTSPGSVLTAEGFVHH